jgi:hypothetical protein
MRGRDKATANDKRDELFAAAEWKCCVCGRLLGEEVPQLAHRIPKTAANLRSYGTEVINHELNLVPVEKLSCNSRSILNFGPAEILLKRIKRVVSGEDPSPDMTEEYRLLREEFEQRRTK